MKQIKQGEVVEVGNKDFRFGESATGNLAAIVERDGEEWTISFTEYDWKVMLGKAARNPSDMPTLKPTPAAPTAPKCSCFLCRLKRFFHA